MNTDKVQLQRDAQGLATVTLNNPAKHNAFDDDMIATLTDVFRQVDADDSVRVMVLNANGKHFCAGADLAWMQRMATYDYEENLRDARALATMLQTLVQMATPTVARVQGAAFGGGVGLVSCCDIAVGSDTALFSLSEVKLGLIPATISPYVIAAIGARAARRYFTTAERFDALRALQLGLLSECVTEDALDTSVAAITKAIAANGPRAVRAAKQLIHDVQASVGGGLSSQLIEMTSEQIASIRSSDEGREGLSAFLEKRPASWLSTGE